MAAKRSSQTKSLFAQLTLADGITLLNILAGFAAILFASRGLFGSSSAALLVAVVFDSLDGKVARRMGTVHDLGKQLDSLADFVSFGIAPAVLLYAKFSPQIPGIIFPLALFVLCGGLRLARFNVLNLQGTYLGIPITANGIFIPMLLDLRVPAAAFVVIPLLSAALMVSSIRVKKKTIQYLASALILCWVALHLLGVHW